MWKHHRIQRKKKMYIWVSLLAKNGEQLGIFPNVVRHLSDVQPTTSASENISNLISLSPGLAPKKKLTVFLP